MRSFLYLLCFVCLPGVFLAQERVGINTTSPQATLHVADGSLLLSGQTGGTPVSGAGIRLMWVPEKAAFRAGLVDNDQWDNVNIGDASAVVGGSNNKASGIVAFAGGGAQNQASGWGSFIGGGQLNSASEPQSFIGGGLENQSSASRTFIGGGYSNTVSGTNAFIGGGRFNIGSATNSFIGGGEENIVSAPLAFVGGGLANHASNWYSFVGGGGNNHASGWTSYVGGGHDNESSGAAAVIAGGGHNLVSGNYTFTGGGFSLRAQSVVEAVFGRFNAELNGNPSQWISSDPLFVIGNGLNDSTRSNALTVLKNGRIGAGTTAPATRIHIEGGGILATGTTGGTPVSGGGTRLMWIPEKAAFRAGSVNGFEWDDNQIGSYSFVGGGSSNRASNLYCFIGGGDFNVAHGTRSFVGGGAHNSVLGNNAFIAGGSHNSATGAWSAISAGSFNVTAGSSAFIAGGQQLRANTFAEVAIGQYNVEITGNATGWSGIDPLFAIGNGLSDAQRSNALTVFKSGTIGIGTISPQARLHMHNGAFILTGSSGSTIVSGAGTRLMWIPEKKAFRAGEVNGSQWNEGSIGSLSFVGGGLNNTASGEATSAIGGVANTASGQNATVIGGNLNLASNLGSAVTGGILGKAEGVCAFVGAGEQNSALGWHSSVSGGRGLTAYSYGEAVVGLNNEEYSPIAGTSGWNAADRLFVVGSGVSSENRSNALTILKNGNTGIGTSAPAERLHVAGNIHVSGADRSILNRSNNALILGSNNTERMRIAANGNVGIGTASPDTRLHISHNGFNILTLHRTTTLGANIVFTNSNGTLASVGGLDGGELSFRTNGSDTPDERLRITAAGNVGISRVPATNRLEVNGNASKTTAGDWLANSDARLKKNIQRLNSQEMLDKLLTLQGITYEWNDDKTGSDRPEGVHYGFTAQNIQKVFPTLVEEDALGFLQTAYSTYDAMIVEALRALQDQISVLEAMNAQLEETLRAVVSALSEKGKEEVSSLTSGAAPAR